MFDDEDVGGRLLILGAPGSGKTTTMLELAAELTRRAEDDPEEPMPVLFNLSSWKDDKQPISEWLVGELKLKYGARKDIGKNWVEGRRLLPMLDGLDELKSGRQEWCVGAINDLLRGECRPDFLVVCSRLEEYKFYKSRLLLNGAVCLQPLSEVQIEGYLAECQRPGLWSTIREDAALLELVRTPLFLSMTVVAEISMAEWGELRSSEKRLSYLLDAYVVRMLTREINSKVFSDEKKAPSPRQTRFWLIWVAQQLERESQTEFLIETMQPYLLVSGGQNFLYNLIVLLILWLMVLPILEPILRINFTLIVIFSIIYFLIRQVAKSLHKIKSGYLLCSETSALFSCCLCAAFLIPLCLILLYILTLILGLIFKLNFMKILALILGVIMLPIIFGVPFMFLVFEVLGVSRFVAKIHIKEVQARIYANQGIWNSLLATTYSTIIALFATAVFIFLSNSIKFNIIKVIYSVLAAIFPLTTILTFGRPVIQHFSLRLVLYITGKIPWNYARFLDYATERTILQRVGGGYRFIHRLLQEHFASLGK